MLAFAAGRVRRRVVPAILLLTLVCAGNAAAQSFLGTVRGTVVDPQGAAVAGAAILIVDEATGAPRTLETDAQGRYEAANIKPGTYRVEVVTTNFKKYERPGVLVRATATALIDITLEIGSVNETVTVSADAVNNITLDSQAIARGLDEQQLRDLPRDSRDIQSFLLLNPNVVGGSATTCSSLAARPTACRTSRTGRPPRTPSSGPSATPHPASTRSRSSRCCPTRYSAEYGGLAGVIVTTKRGSSRYSGTSFYDFNSDSLNALTYNQTLSGTQRGDPLPTRTSTAGARALGGPCSARSVLLRRTTKARTTSPIFGGAGATVPTPAMRNGDFRGTAISPRDPHTGAPFANQMIPADRIDPAARTSWISSTRCPIRERFANGYGRVQAVRPRNAETAQDRSTSRPRGEQERHALPARQLSALHAERDHVRRRATR